MISLKINLFIIYITFKVLFYIIHIFKYIYILTWNIEWRDFISFYKSNIKAKNKKIIKTWGKRIEFTLIIKYVNMSICVKFWYLIFLLYFNLLYISIKIMILLKTFKNILKTFVISMLMSKTNKTLLFLITLNFFF